MLEADTPRRNVAFWSPARRAWAIILAAFLVFCGTIGGGSYAVLRIVRTPMHATLQVQAQRSEALLIRPVGLNQPNPVDGDADLNVGDTVLSGEKAGLGVVGVVRLAPGEVAVWANTQLQVLQRGPLKDPSRFRLAQGQIMVDLPSAVEPLEIVTPDGTVKLTAPGHYLVRRLAQDSATTAAAERGSAPDTEVAVGSGEAVAGTTHIPAGGRKLLGKPATLGYSPNAWPLLRDGKFRQFSEDDYNHTTVQDPQFSRADSWQVSVQTVVSADAPSQPGQFHLEQECPPTGNDQPCRTAAEFVRRGGNDLPSITAITQTVNADVGAYAKLQLNAAIRIKYQSLSRAGFLGTECPVMIRIFYTNAQDGDQHEADYCFWAMEYKNQKSSESSYPWIRTIRIEPQTWYPFTVDLKHEIPNLLGIQKIEIHANGHDYDTNVADVGLDGIDLSDRPVTSGAPSGHRDQTGHAY